ncbi:MAG: hypothetical protein WBW33_02120 [Bryobacteraceae bacterium]
MTNRLAAGIAAMFMALVCSPRMFGAIADELVLNDGVGHVATIDVSTLGVETCAGTCGGLTILTPGGAHGEIIAIGTLGQFSLDATAEGGGVSTLPTLQNLNQINATSTGVGMLTSTFTDTSYTDVNPLLNIADSNTTNLGIDTSTIKFTVLTDGGNAIPAGTSVYTDTLTGASDSNGLGGVDASNPNSPNASITSMTVMTFVGKGDIQANITVANAVPEPASIVFLGTMMLGLTALIRNRRLKRS